MLGPGRAAVRAEDEERQQQGDGDEGGPVLLRRDRVEDPVDGEQHESGADHVDDGGRERVQLAARALGFELLEQALLGLRIRDRRARHHSTPSVRWTSPP
jgi:hypothetical protein